VLSFTMNAVRVGGSPGLYMPSAIAWRSLSGDQCSFSAW
jgi:hypothetical protein